MKTCSEQPRNVVPLWHRKDHQMGSVVSTVMTHWTSLRRDGGIPRRADLDPQALAPALPNAFLLERPRPDAVRFRLAGQHLHHTMGMDVRGMPLRAFFEIPDRKRLMEKVFQVFSDPAIVDLELVSDAQGRAILEGRMCLMPLTGPEGQINRALGVLVTDGLVGLPPRRFRIRHLSLTRLAAGPDSSGVIPSQPGQSADPARPLQERPALRLVQGGLS
ncbi:PAS domain-containing protein [Nioella sp. MMSF_3534]|uniref:PAS domain-containing protein n=1 Tax=Nioella sp. MMSF_3534 TaxID=3046720 RepID=UPI00273EDFD8|nr:PAS domain-containing protein [Nioella sp. MMSF_3534]